MLPKWHVLFGFIFSYIIVYFFNFPLLTGTIIFLSSILIDIDHYIRYIVKKKNLSVFRFWNWSMENHKKWQKVKVEKKRKYKLPHFFLHGIEFFIPLIILSFLHEIFFWILIGIIFHMVFDLVDLVYKQDPIYMKMSQIWVYKTNKNRIMYS